MPLQDFSAELRRQFPDLPDLRLRCVNRRNRTIFQVIGTTPDNRNFARQLEADSPFTALDAARTLIPLLVAGDDLVGRVMPTGELRQQERAALLLIERSNNRQEVKNAKSRALKNLTAWLTEHELPIQTATLLRAIRDTDQAKRERRGRIQAAYLMARIANVKLQVPQEEQYRKPKVPLVETVTDHQIIEAYDELRSNCRRPEVAWLMGVMITTGCRATTALTMELDGISDVGDEILAWDSKRARQTKTTPTLRGKWQAWNLSDRPSVIDDVLMPSDRPASDDQIWRANQWINGALKSARRSVSATNSEILGARSLRSATVARLLRAGASTLQAATLVSTSEEMVQERYARFFKSETVSAVSGLL